MSCNITVSVSDDFAKEAKRLAKKYHSFKQDYKEFLDSIKENPLQGDEITGIHTGQSVICFAR